MGADLVKTKIGAFALGLTLFAMGLVPTLASANRIYVGWSGVWTNQVRCLEGKVTTDHGSLGNGYFQFEGRGAEADLPDYPLCVQEWSLGAGKYRIRLAAWKTNASQNCIDTGWVKNASTTFYMKISRPANPTGNPYQSPPCNNGYYWTKGKIEGTYNGGWTTQSNWLLIDEAHHLPTTPGGNGG
jgi:hypothetical protein